MWAERYLLWKSAGIADVSGVTAPSVVSAKAKAVTSAPPKVLAKPGTSLSSLKITDPAKARTAGKLTTSYPISSTSAKAVVG